MFRACPDANIIMLNFVSFQWYVIFMQTLKEKIDEIISNFETDYYDPKEEVLIRHLDNPELFEFLFPWPKPPREEQTRQIIEALLS